MRLRVLTSCVAFGLLFFAACGQTTADGDDDGEPTTPPTSAAGKEEACQKTCELLAACDESIDVDTCAKDCADDESISRAGQEAIADCLEDLDCDEMQTEAALLCLLGGIGETPPSEEGEKFCNESLARLNECSSEGQPGMGGAGGGGLPPQALDPDTCELSISLGSDELLSDLNSCLEADKSCQSAQICVGLKVYPLLQAGGEAGIDLGDLLGGMLGGTPGGTPDAPPPPDR